MITRIVPCRSERSAAYQHGRLPGDWRRRSLPSPTEMIPRARSSLSAMYSPSFTPRFPSSVGDVRRDHVFRAGPCANVGRQRTGSPRDARVDRGVCSTSRAAARHCVALKNQMYIQLSPRTLSGLGESRMTRTRTPMSTRLVSSRSAVRFERRFYDAGEIRSSNRKCPTTCHSSPLVRRHHG